MPGLELKAGQAYEFTIRLTDTANRPQPKEAVRWNDLTVVYHGYGSINWITKTISSGDWRELGVGGYLLAFTTAELATAGDYAFIITSRPLPYATFDDYPGNIYLVTYNSADEQSDITSLSTNLGAVQNTVQDTYDLLVFMRDTVQDTYDNVVTVKTNVEQAHAYLLGRQVWDFTTDPWTITVYGTDNTTLVAQFSYTNDDAYEERRRV